MVTKFGWIYGGAFLVGGPLGTKGKEALVFTERGVYGAGLTQVRVFQLVHEVQLRKSFREFREVKIIPYEIETQRQGTTSYCIALENFRMSFPAGTRRQLVNVLKLIQALLSLLSFGSLFFRLAGCPHFLPRRRHGAEVIVSALDDPDQSSCAP